MKKRIIITGGSGFVGKNLTEQIAKKNYNVFAPSSKELNLLDENAVRNYILQNKIEIIIHGANVGGGRNTVGMTDVVHTNLRMFFNVVRNIPLVKKIIYFGSGAEYDKSRPLQSISEEDFDKKIPKDDYGFYKYVCSKYTEHDTSGKLVCLRLFGIYGKYENYLFKFISNTIVKNLLKLPISIMQNVYFDYMHISDLIPIITFFIEHKSKYKHYNISTGKRIDLVSLANIINNASDFKSEIIIKNPWLQNEYTASNTRLLKEIPMGFTPHKTAIENLYCWYKNNLEKLDIDAIKKDPYIKNIKIKK